ncbi:hypothetical protein CBR_g51545 [Chara braunii]|uniref:Integrase zinc-binding domain-containing protein n=1 Tax=Chara braunii TaxID=69332 RepID=A0A388M8Q8_CHABU|nr:hypothetical protein CBR_g51545 [Chara braunii]|eukprot:GBG90941.1 hypothetical protein CBR_g51545 [Chara braunii]
MVTTPTGGVTQPQAKAAKNVVEQVEDDDDDKEEKPVRLTKSQRKARNQAAGGQGSGKNAGVQAAAPAQVNANQASTSGAPPQGLAQLGPWPGVISSVWPGYTPYGPWPFYNQVGPAVGGSTANAAGGYPNAPAQGVNWQGEGQQQQQAPPRQVNQPSQAGGQGQGQNQGGNGQSSQGRGNGGRGRGNGNGGQGGQGGGRGGNWNGQGGNDRPRFDWRNVICHHCALKGHTFRFCQIRKVDEENGLISTNMDGDVYDMYGKYIDPKIAGGMRKEAQRRVELGPPPSAMFRLWQEEDVRSTIKVEELANSKSEEDIRREESVVIEEEEEEESHCQGRVIDTMERMEDLVEKMQRLNLKMRSICDEVTKSMVLGSETGPSSVKPARQTLGSTPRSGITFRPPRGQSTFPQGVCTRSKKGDPSSSQEPPSESQPREKESVTDVGHEGKEDEEDERLRREEEEQAAQRANKGSWKIGQKERQKEKARGSKRYVKRADIVLKDFVKENPWGGKGVEWMAKLALTETFQLGEDPLAIESGAYSLDTHAKYVADVSFLVNSIVQVYEDGEGSRDPVRDMEEDEFEEGEITEVFCADEYEGVYHELGLLLSCEMRERKATKKVLKMRPRFLVRDGHLFIKNEVGNLRRLICGRNRQIDVIAALHDGSAGGHRAFALTYAKARELYYWEGMSEMIRKYCESCVPCQIRALSSVTALA